MGAIRDHVVLVWYAVRLQLRGEIVVAGVIARAVELPDEDLHGALQAVDMMGDTAGHEP